MSCETWPSNIHTPSTTCPIFLQATLNTAGTGHTFMSLMTALHLAVKLNATLNTQLPKTTGHNIIHDLLQPNFTNPTNSCTQIHTFKTFQNFSDLNTSLITPPVTDWIQNCYASKTRDKCATILLKPKVPPAPTISGINQIRAIFKHKHVHFQNDTIHISIHIRRGDLHQYIRTKKTGVNYYTV